MRETEIAMHIFSERKRHSRVEKDDVKETKTVFKDSVRCALFVLDRRGCHPCGRRWPRSSTFEFM